MAVNGASALLIFVPRAVHSHDLALSLVAGNRVVSATPVLMDVAGGHITISSSLTSYLSDPGGRDSIICPRAAL